MCSFNGYVFESAKLRVLRALVPFVPRTLRALVPHVPRNLRALVSHVSLTSCALCSNCSLTSPAFVPYVPLVLVSFMYQYHFFYSCFPMLHVTFSYLFHTRQFFWKFTAVKVKIICW